MKKYALFYGQQYYPCGGWGDYQATADTIEELKEYMAKQDQNDIDWAQIVELATGEIVWDE